MTGTHADPHPDARPLASVVMPAYNAEKFIEKSIDSVLDQSERNFELVIVDDGSKDSTPAIISKKMSADKRIRYFRTELNKGPSHTRNYGIEQAKGEYIAFLDADDIMSRTALESRIKALEGNGFACGSFCDMVLIDDKDEPLGITIRHQPSIAFIDLLENKFPTSMIVLRASALKEEGGFDNSFRHGEDWDLWLRLTRTGKVFARSEDGHIKYRQYGDSLTHGNLLKDFSERMMVLERAMGIDPNCKNPIPEFRNGLADALKHEQMTTKALVLALSELVAGKRENAAVLMDNVSLNLMPLLRMNGISNRCKFMIKRNLCLDEKEWIRRSYEFSGVVDEFLRGYRYEELKPFYSELLRSLFPVYQAKESKKPIQKEQNNTALVKTIKAVCRNNSVNRMLGSIHVMTGRANQMVSVLYNIGKEKSE